MKTRGFTLWELLIVIVLIAIVVAILFPVFAKPRQVHYRSCASNEKILGVAIMQYEQDNDMMMPNIAQAPGSTITWRSFISAYFKDAQRFQCPNRDEDESKTLGPDGFPRSYAANYSGNYSGGLEDQGQGAFAGPGAKAINFVELENPATLIMLCEVHDSNTPEFNIDDALRFGPAKHILWAGHNDGSNYSFADGHVKYLKPNNTNYDATDLKGHRRHWNLWYRDHAKPLSANGAAVLTETQAYFSR